MHDILVKIIIKIYKKITKEKEEFRTYIKNKEMNYYLLCEK